MLLGGDVQHPRLLLLLRRPVGWSSKFHIHRADSGSDGSSEGSDADSNNDSPARSEGRHEVGEVTVSQNGNSTYVTQNGVVNGPHTIVNPAMAVGTIAAPGGVGPATNLNIGMEYWGTPASSPIPAIRGQVATGVVSTGSRDNLQSQLWIQTIGIWHEDHATSVHGQKLQRCYCLSLIEVGLKTIPIQESHITPRLEEKL